MVFDALHLAVIVFLAAAAIFAASPLVIAFLIAPRNRGGEFQTPYECGVKPYGRAWDHFGFNYHIYALIFIAFDVDVLYLIPVGAAYRLLPGLMPLAELSFFLFFVLLAVLYFNAKGVFYWPRRLTMPQTLE
ncbi:MAG: NADH-quinone oxidoreductase subunit A [Deltaproteobacteria bacterium]|jgi:NADH-quinone oxidoreductase subunit A|nr:NADH-quinone oxidoreductase subunit A [Deltaproteobacteria bacterium]